MDMSQALQQFASPPLDTFALAITELGSHEAYSVFLLVTYLALAFGFLLGSRALVPDGIRQHGWGEFVRYALLGYTVTLLTPWLARRLRLVPPLKRL